MSKLRNKIAAACVALALLTPMAGFAEHCVTVGTKYHVATIFGFEIEVTVSTTTCTD